MTSAIASSGCAVIPIVDSRNQTGDFLGEQEREGEDYESRVRTDDGNTPFSGIRIGDCLDDSDEMGIWSDGYYVEALSLDVVDCAEPHNSEVFGITSLEGEAFPGDDAVYTTASGQCAEFYEPYVGITLEEALTLEAASPLSIHYYGPGPESWDAGDRDALCVLFDVEDRPLVGSVVGGPGPAENERQ